jgi:hypothetical protein
MFQRRRKDRKTKQTAAFKADYLKMASLISEWQYRGELRKPGSVVTILLIKFWVHFQIEPEVFS